MKTLGVKFAGLVLAASLFAAGCASNTAARQEAKSGAKYGALTGAVSGFFWGLLRGEALQGAVEGAFVGGATGAVVGGVHGSEVDRDLKAEFGELNYKGVMALVHRNYAEAKKYAEQTADSPDVKVRHASAWLSALIAKETLNEEDLVSSYSRLIELDPDVRNREDARVEIRLAQHELKLLRKQFNVR